MIVWTKDGNEYEGAGGLWRITVHDYNGRDRWALLFHAPSGKSWECDGVREAKRSAGEMEATYNVG